MAACGGACGEPPGTDGTPRRTAALYAPPGFYAPRSVPRIFFGGARSCGGLSAYHGPISPPGLGRATRNPWFWYRGGRGICAALSCGSVIYPPVRLPSPVEGEGSYWSPGSKGAADHQMRAAVLESQGAQTKAGNVLVLLGGQATHANTPHDRARLGVQNDKPALHRRQIRISHLGDRTALAPQAIGVC